MIFTSGKGIAATKALLESSADVASLNVSFRKDVRVYYKVRHSSQRRRRDDFRPNPRCMYVQPCSHALPRPCPPTRARSPYLGHTTQAPTD